MRIIMIAAVCAGCGGGVGDGLDGPPLDGPPMIDGGGEPRDVPDDVAPYALASGCADLTTWTLPASHLSRVAAVGPREAWVIGNYLPVPEGGGDLMHLRPDGTVEPTEWTDVHDVWTCDGELWAVGGGGLVLRRRGDAPFERVDPGLTADLLGGFGCGDELWLAAGDRVVVRRGDAAETFAIEVDQGSVWPLRMHGAGRARVATEYYGAVLAFDPVARVFRLAGGTDDIITDAFVQRDGTGISLHGGYGLVFEPAMPNQHVQVEGLVASRVARRADDDAWFTGGGVATHLTAGGLEALPLPGFFDEDVDARADSVWVVGFDGAAVLTAAGFCPVAE